MINKAFSINRSLSKRGLLILLGSIVAAVWLMQGTAQPQLPTGQKPLTDINSIEALRAQFNRNAGLIRLVIFVVPT